MSRSFTAQNLIQLPRLGAAETVVLTTQLLTAAETAANAAPGKQLPPPIERSRTRLTAAHAALNAVVEPQVAGDTQVRRKADRWIDSAWSAGYDWLSGWCKLPPEKNPYHAEARALMALVFPDALGFTKLPYRVEWQQSKTRLEAIAREGHGNTFHQLGGAAFLANITEAQEAYGRALNITVPVEVEATGEVRARLVAALAAVRDYVNRVAAYAEPDVPGSDELAEALLLPLSIWESAQRPSTPDTAPDAGPPAAPCNTTP